MPLPMVPEPRTAMVLMVSRGKEGSFCAEICAMRLKLCDEDKECNGDSVGVKGTRSREKLAGGRFWVNWIVMGRVGSKSRDLGAIAGTGCARVCGRCDGMGEVESKPAPFLKPKRVRHPTPGHVPATELGSNTELGFETGIRF